MARAVSVKIPTSKVIEMIESKLAEMDKSVKEYPALFNAYTKANKEYAKAVIELAGKNTNKVVAYQEFDWTSDQIAISSDYRGSVQFYVGKALASKIGEKPERPTDPDNYSFKQNKEQLEKTLKLLRMTEQESVSASTYNSVLDLI
jgi:hypothetical protein